MIVDSVVKKATLLVVDDNPRVIQSLNLILTDYEVLSAKSGEEALAILSKPNTIDLVLLDIKMQGLNGLEVLNKIKGKKEFPGVIMVSAMGEKENILEALRGRADDFLEKPFKPADARRVVGQYLSKRFCREKDKGTATSPIQRVIKLLERNVDQDVTLEDASRVASLSPKYLSRLFLKKTGKSFLKYKMQLKLNEAEKLLKGTELDINSIAYKIGYQNSESFMKAFKKDKGLTPSEFREACFHSHAKKRRFSH